MAHSQSRVTATLPIGARAAPILDEEHPKALLGTGQILLRIDRPKDRVGGDALVETMDQPAKCLLTADRVIKGDLCCFTHGRSSLACTRPPAGLRETQRTLRGVGSAATQRSAGHRSSRHVQIRQRHAVRAERYP